ncbi:MAG: nucleotidyltransferase domain-containing protein [Ignisphaera sp.]
MLDDLKSLVESYRNRFSLKLVVLFGSRARGNYTDESDIDILVVADNLPKDPREAFSMLRDARYPSVNPIGFNTEVFLKKLRSGSTFLLEILDEGAVLYADKEFYTMVMKIYEDVRRRYVRRGKTWIEISEQ